MLLHQVITQAYSKRTTVRSRQSTRTDFDTSSLSSRYKVTCTWSLENGRVTRGIFGALGHPFPSTCFGFQSQLQELKRPQARLLSDSRSSLLVSFR